MSFLDAKVIGACCPRSDYPGQDLKRGDPAKPVSQSDLKLIAHNPHKWLHGAQDDDSTVATRFGSLLDCMLLTPHQFQNRYALVPESYHDAKTGELKPWNFNANVCKVWREEQAGKECIKGDEFNGASQAVRNLQNDPDISAVLKESSNQVLLTGEYECDNGLVVPVCGLIDVVPTLSALADVKTGVDVSSGIWPRTVFQRGYHVQAAFYLDLFNAAKLGPKRETFLHICIESAEPFEVGRRVFDSEFIKIGRAKYKAALEIYSRCIKENSWPSYDEPGAWTPIEAEAWMVMKDGKALLKDQWEQLGGDAP